MYRDFSENSRQNLLNLVSQVENEKLSNFTDWIGDRWYDFESWIGKLNIKKYLDNVNEYHKKVIDKNNTTKDKINEIFLNVHKVDNNYQSVFLGDREIMNAVLSYIQELSAVINPSNGIFESDPTFVTSKLGGLSYFELIKNLDKLGSPSYIHRDGEHYGGYQGSAYRKWKKGEGDEIEKIIRKHFPNCSDAQIEKLLDEMRHEGCRYTAYVNTIFGEYNRHEEDFEEDFGFPMYDEEGYPNWDLVIVDFYCSEGEINGEQDGLNKFTGEKRWEHYLRSKGIEVDAVNIDVTVDTYENLSEQGEIIIGMSPVQLRNRHGQLVYSSDGGHAVVITGIEIINGKQMYKVSSWGEVYYVDPNDFNSDKKNINYFYYQQVRYDSGLSA